MAIHPGLAGFRVRPDAAPTFIHKDCRQELKRYPGLQDRDQLPIVLKCDACDKIIGEWTTEEEMDQALLAWFENHVE